MRTISGENSKALREHMQVLCGIDTDTTVITATPYGGFNEIQANAKITTRQLRVPLMDLAGDGFMSDGEAIPLSETANANVKTGLVSSLVTDSSGSFLCDMVITVNAAGTYTVHCYSGNKYRRLELETNNLLQLELPLSGWEPNCHVYVDRVTKGTSIQYTNHELISCKLTLRGMQTTLNNPSLQASEVEIEAYDDDLDEELITKYEDIAKYTNVWYTAGYPQDFSELRNFFLSDKITGESKKITIKATDATEILDDIDFPCSLVHVTTTKSFAKTFVDMIGPKMQECGVSYTSENVPTGSSLSEQFYAVFPNKKLREVISDLCTWYKPVHDSNCFKYIDAGKPRFIGLVDKTDVTPITKFGKVSYTVDKYDSLGYANKEFNNNARTFEVLESGTSEEANEIHEWSSSDNYYSVFNIHVSSGTAEIISQTCNSVTYKIGSSGVTYSLSGMPLSIRRYTDLTTTADVVLPEFYGFDRYSDGYLDIKSTLRNYLRTSQKLIYNFEWRGDPRLQPGDYISLSLGGVTTNMTIEEVTLEHSSMGLKSNIKARGGLQ